MKKILAVVLLASCTVVEVTQGHEDGGVDVPVFGPHDLTSKCDPAWPYNGNPSTCEFGCAVKPQEHPCTDPTKLCNDRPGCTATHQGLDPVSCVTTFVIGDNRGSGAVTGCCLERTATANFQVPTLYTCN